MAVTSPQTATVKPATSGAYLCASALYNAGFRGWPLTVMTAIAGRESRWKPTALDNNASTGDYSVGLTQINYYGDLYNSRVASYGSPSSLSASPQAQANATFDLAGGNSLSGLGNWALSPSPQNGTVPTPTSSGYDITPYLAQAATATAMVGTMGPAPASQIANENAWPGTPTSGLVTPTSGGLLGQGVTASSSSGSSAASSSSGSSAGCNALGNISVFGYTLLTRCQTKGLLGGLAIAGGGALMIVGLSLIVVAGLKGKGPAAPLVQTAQGAASVGGWAKGLFSSGATTAAA
jgi:hypothetical protein